MHEEIYSNSKNLGKLAISGGPKIRSSLMFRYGIFLSEWTEKYELDQNMEKIFNL